MSSADACDGEAAAQAGADTLFGPWSGRCLSVARFSAIAVAVCAPVSSALTSAAAVLMVLAWVISGRAHRLLIDTLRQPVGLALAVFLVIVTAGLLYGAADFSARYAGLLGWRRLAYALIPLALFGALVWKRRFVKIFVWACALWVAATFLSKWGWVPSKAGQQAGVLLQNHATQGITFALGVLCALQWARELPSTARRWLIGLAIVLAANIIFVTPARSGYLALLVVLMVSGWSVVGLRRGIVWTALVMATMLAAYAASTTMRERVDAGLHETLKGSDAEHLTSMGTRVLFYKTAWNFVQESPLVGFGSGGFGKHYSETVQRTYTDWRATPSSDPHNMYLFIAVENGIIGLAAFLMFLAVCLRGAARDPMGWIGTGALLVIMATSLFSSHFRTFPEAHLVAMFIGVFFAATSQEATRRSA